MESILRFHRRTLIVADKHMEETIRLASRAANTQAPVLLCGESGTGKELVARFIHEKSFCSSGPFVSVNCAAIPDGLIESEFFGFEKGAFTGAITQQIGKFERANGGTLLLDEISEMPFPLQAKLLRVLQEGEMERLGGKEVIPVKCRIIATTNRDPIQLIREGKFREDLYYRLNVFRIECSPLKGREKAIEVLVSQFVEQLSEKHGLSHKTVSPGGLDLLKSYPWPGNIRELQNVLERALLTTDHDEMREDDFLFSVTQESKATGENLSDVEERHIVSILQSVGGSQTKAADKLGITTRTLRNKMKLYSGRAK